MALSKFIKEASRYSEKISLFHVIILSCFFALISIINHHSGVLYIETEVRLPFYLSDIPFLNKLFDSQLIEVGKYRARELSYVLDFIDSKFIELCIENGFPHFLSLAHYLFSITIGCLLWLFCVKELNLRPLTGIGLLGLFWTSPSIFFGGIYFRASKIGVALLVTVLFYVIYKVVIVSRDKPDTQISRKLWLAYCMAIFLISFLDEQGVFFIFVVAVFLSIWGLVSHYRNIYIMLVISIVSIVFHALYRYSIAPHLTFVINGYWPNFDYQIMPVQMFIKNIDYYLSAGIFLYLDTFRFLIGIPSRTIATGLLVFLLIIAPVFHIYIITDRYKKYFFWMFLQLLILNFLLIIMNALMFFRHPLLICPDVMRIYYLLPMNVIFTMILAVLISDLHKSDTARRIILMLICIAFAGNILALPKHRDIIRQGQKSYIQPSLNLLNALKNMDFLDHARDPSIRQNLVFKYFKSKKDNPPSAHDGYNKQGIYYAEHGQYRKAIDNFSLAVMQEPGNIRFRLSRAYMCFKLGNYQQAIDDLSEVLSRKPDYAEAYNNRGFAYINEGDTEQGCHDAQKACTLGNCSLLEKANSEGLCR